MIPTEDDLRALDLLAKRDDLSEWEESFLESLSTRQIWTDKQKAKFDQLCDEKLGT